MNEWIEKSIELANSKGYLDKLHNIYEMKENLERPISKEAFKKIKKAFDKRHSKKLIKLLIICAEIFPVKDSYIGFIRKKMEALEENPKTTKRLAKRLYSLGFKRMIQEAIRPKETNRQLGNAFRNWSQNKLGFKVVDEKIMLKNNKGIVILKGGDGALSNFAREHLKCVLRKGIDIVIKKDKKYLIGEAKFLTTPGGEQDRGFDDAENFVNNKSGNVTRIAILDGYVWLESTQGLHNKIIKSKKETNIMSALLLKDFLNSV